MAQLCEGSFHLPLLSPLLLDRIWQVAAFSWLSVQLAFFTTSTPLSYRKMALSFLKVVFRRGWETRNPEVNVKLGFNPIADIVSPVYTGTYCATVPE